MRDLIRDLSGRGMTVLLSSHLLAEVEELCNRVAIVRSRRRRLPGLARRAPRQAGGSYLLRTTDDERAARVAAAQAGIEEVAPGADGGLIFARRERGRGRRALAGAGRVRCADPGAEPAPREPRGSLLPADRGRRHGRERRRSRPPRPWRARRDARRPDRLPLGAAQAARPEAHLPRPRRGGGGADHLRHRPRRSERRQPNDVAFGRYVHDTGLAIPLVLLLFGSVWMFPLITALVAGDIVAAEDRNQHPEDDPHPLGRAPAGLRRQGPGHLHLRGRGDRRHRGRRARRRHPRLRLQLDRHPLRARGSRPREGLGLVGASLLVYLVPILAIACDRPALLDRLPQQRRGDRRHADVLAAGAADRHPARPRRAPSLPAEHPVQRLAGASCARRSTGRRCSAPLWVCALYAVPALVAAGLVFLRRDVAGD